jgi:Sel1 repeat-containing protein
MVLSGHGACLARRLFAAAAIGGAVTAAPAALAQITHCDELAGHPADPHRIGQGIAFAQINPDQAIDACTAALKDDPDNQRLRFELGRALERSGALSEAATLYSRAAEAGYAAAQMSLGALYQEGMGVPHDETQAVSWFRKAAEQNHVLAEDALGTAYRDGRGVAKDEGQAIAWLKKAADQGYDPARAKLLDLSAKAAPRAAPAAAPTPVPPPPPAPPAPPAPAPQIVAPVPVVVPAPSPSKVAPTPQAAAPVSSAPPAAQATIPAPPPVPAPAATPAPVAPKIASPAPVTAPTPPPQLAAKPGPSANPPSADDPQFASGLGAALQQCILPEAKSGHYSGNPGLAIELLVGKCQRPWMAWVNDCVAHGGTQDSCIAKSAGFAQATIQRFTN